MSNDSDDTAETPVPPGLRGEPGPRLRSQVAARTHPGKRRTNNEDHYLITRLARSLEVVASNLPGGEVPERFEEEGHVLIVADGVGGKKAGEVASGLALSLATRLFLERGRWKLRLEDGPADVADRAIGILQDVDDILGQRAAANPALAGMATTLTAALIAGPDLLVVHVGDSRAYLQHENSLVRLTRDHTVAQDFADLGLIPSSRVATHPYRHVLTNALGRRDGQLHVAWQHLELQANDLLLLCTDGLTGELADVEIARQLDANADPEQACQALVDRALAAGGRDNVTVAVARILPAQA